jgi:hypothetical protein
MPLRRAASPMSVIAAALCEAGDVVAPELPRGCHVGGIGEAVINASDAGHCMVGTCSYNCALHGPDRLPLLLKHHRSHHQVATRNYGVGTTLWDHIFGTILR